MVLVPIGFVSDHMEVVYDLDTEALATAERLGLDAVRACRPSGTDPRFVAMVRDLLVERAAVERGETVDRAAVGGRPACWDRVPRPAAAPTRAAALPGAVRPAARPCGCRRDPPRGRRRAPHARPARPRPRHARARPAALIVRLRQRRGRGRRHQVQPDRHRHRGRPGLRERWSASGCSAPGPTTASSARRASDVAGTSGVVWIVDPIDGTVNYLYGHPALRGLIAAEVDGEVVAGVVLDAASAAAFTAVTVGGGATPATAQPIRSRAADPLGQRWSAPASATSSRRGPARPATGADAAADPRHPPTRLLRPGPLRGGLPGTLDAYVEEGAAHLGPRRGRAGRRGGRRCPRGRAVPAAATSC